MAVLLGQRVAQQWPEFEAAPDGEPAAAEHRLGQPVVALLIGVGLAMTLPKRFDREMLSMSGWVGEAIVGAATIIIITGAGGAFGKVLQNSGIADVIGGALTGSNLGVWLPFIIAAGIKTAQGSSTVAIITTAGLIAPLLSSLGLDGETWGLLMGESWGSAEGGGYPVQAEKVRTLLAAAITRSARS